MNKQWEQRNCRNCKIQLGCPYSTLAERFMIQPTEDVKLMILETICSKLKIRDDR